LLAVCSALDGRQRYATLLRRHAEHPCHLCCGLSTRDDCLGNFLALDIVQLLAQDLPRSINGVSRRVSQDQAACRNRYVYTNFGRVKCVCRQYQVQLWCSAWPMPLGSRLMCQINGGTPCLCPSLGRSDAVPTAIQRLHECHGRRPLFCAVCVNPLSLKDLALSAFCPLCLE
jgi:hypothetical protein